MGSRYLEQLADWCRAAGLETIEVDGWEHRARSSGGFDGDRPWCVMWHHTASSTSPQNDANYICFGSPDAPISNLLLARDGSVWVCAGGATNTNGKGGPRNVTRGQVPKDSMNTYAVSIEAANNGVGEPWPQEQIDAYFTLSLMLCERLGLAPDDICEHAVWAPDRKIDPATAAAVQGPWRPGSANSSGTWDQSTVEAELWHREGPLPPEDDVQLIELRIVEANAAFLAYKLGDYIPWVEWVNGADPLQLARLEAYRAMGVQPITMSVVNLAGCCLIGPLPTGDRRTWTRADFGNVIA